MKSIHFNVQLDATTLITPGIASKLIFKLIVVHYWTSLINRVHFGTTLFAFWKNISLWPFIDIQALSMLPREEVMSRNLLMSLRMVITWNSWHPPSLLCRQHFKLQSCTLLLNKSTSSVCLSSLVCPTTKALMICFAYIRGGIQSFPLDTIPGRQCPPNKPVYCIPIFPGHSAAQRRSLWRAALGLQWSGKWNTWQRRRPRGTMIKCWYPVDVEDDIIMHVKRGRATSLNEDYDNNTRQHIFQRQKVRQAWHPNGTQ